LKVLILKVILVLKEASPQPKVVKIAPNAKNLWVKCKSDGQSRD
jgi:hypothetical protein